MIKQKYFTIIIPSLNEERYLPKLLDDLVGQTMDDFDVIVVDGKSEDRTVEKCLLYKNRLAIKVIKSGKRNVSFQRNHGASKAKGEWIVFMDADNRLPEYFLDGLKYRILKEKPDCFTTYMTPDTKNPSDEALIKFINLGMEINNMMDAPTIFGSMFGIRQQVFKKYKGFDETVGFAEDAEYIRRLFKKGVNFKVFKDPRYTFSLRHFRREGRLKYMTSTAKLHLKNFAGLKIDQESEYPMGGYIKEKKNGNDFSFLFKDVKLAFKKPKVLKKIKNYLNYLEGDF